MPKLREFRDKQQRHAEHFENVLRSANDLYEHGGENVTLGLAKFDLEWPNIAMGQAWAVAHIETDNVAAKLSNEYPDAGSFCLQLRQNSRERINWLESALSGAQRLNHRRAESAHLGNLGISYKNLGDVSRAIEFYEQALVIARETDDRNGESQALGNLGTAYSILGEASRAIEFYEKCLTLHREIGDRRGEGADLGHLGIAYNNLGETRRAIEFYEQRLVIAHEMGDKWGEGSVSGNLGSAYISLGKVRRAIEFYEQQLSIAREIGDRHGEGNAFWGIAICFEKDKDRNQAIVHAKAALEIFTIIESPSAKKLQNLLKEWQKPSLK
jgi:tetratricopeptide (TPR) repeat protein